MLKRSMILMMLAALFLTPAVLEAADGDDLIGRWDASRVEGPDGEAEDIPAGSMAVEFFEDGSIKMYEEGQESEEGTYSVEGDQLTVTTDSDDETETTTYSVDGDTMTLSIELAPGVEMKVIFKRTDG